MDVEFDLIPIYEINQTGGIVVSYKSVENRKFKKNVDEVSAMTYSMLMRRV